MKRIQVPEELFHNEAELHKAFSKIMGFPAYYGHNWDAWIDCMSCIDAPDEGMSELTITQGESLEFEILIIDGNNYFKTPTWGIFCSCVAAVNCRFANLGSTTRLIIIEKPACA